MTATPTASGDDALRSLVVIDRLVVGPVRLEPDRLSAPYRIEQNGTSDETELVLKYAEPVFSPGDRASENLATMAAAQIALNYGLFTDELVIHGPLDAADVRFLGEMAENTAREIYVNKLLAPNPYLRGAATALTPEPRSSYCHARLFCPDATGDAAISWPGSDPDRRRIAVLSSGGKDSLLTYGLLHEMGYDVHPVFGNESGRHWFTALNAFRHFEAEIAGTARVWMNADRVFAWMLRHLPFVREDFASIRSDIYPIRLWTVAVFLFATLPLARRRGIGRVVIGNEYDTTRRTRTHGITHYDGLYDQSRYFDNALCRYYHRKSMAIAQFSLLRPVSELLVQHTLAVRYPDLHRHQVSCHAAHKDGDRVRPCGTCEKCRRIVGMLSATGMDPGACGYSPGQVAGALASLEAQHVHQIGSDAEHLAWLLHERQLIGSGRKGRRTPRPHEEVEMLRFDGERSPVDWIPVDLREPLVHILSQYARGAVERVGRRWIPFDSTSERMRQPYAFEKGMPPLASPDNAGTGATPFLWGELTWPVAEERLRAVDVALLPVGAIEQHGPHLPLDTDSFDADYLCRTVASRCRDPKPLVLPLVPYGVSYHHDHFAGTISVTNETLARFVYEIGMAAARNGIAKLVIVNGHGGNAPTLNFAAQMINRDAHIFVCVDSGESSDDEIGRDVVTPNDVHAGEIETSTSLAVRPHLVDMARAERMVPEFSSRYLHFTETPGIPWYAFTHRISDSGVMGDATVATSQKGMAYWQIMIRHLVTFIEELKDMTLDEIYQTKY